MLGGTRWTGSGRRARRLGSRARAAPSVSQEARRGGQGTGRWYGGEEGGRQGHTSLSFFSVKMKVSGSEEEAVSVGREEKWEIDFGKCEDKLLNSEESRVGRIYIDLRR